MTNIAELAAASLAAMDAERAQMGVFHQKERSFREYVENAVKLAREVATAEAEAQFRGGIDDARAEHGRLLAIAEQSAIAHGTAKLATMHQGVWCHWERPHRAAQERVVERGILEVWTRISPRPDNQQHGLPEIGDVAMRLLKKDGTPSVKVARDFWAEWGGDRKPAKNWRPEEPQP